MMFVLGFLLGFLAAVITAGFCVWSLLIRAGASKEGTAKILQGWALALTYKKPPVLVVNSKDGEKEPMGFKLKKKSEA